MREKRFGNFDKTLSFRQKYHEILFPLSPTIEHSMFDNKVVVNKAIFPLPLVILAICKST